jgi:hypothetical protein
MSEAREIVGAVDTFLERLRHAQREPWPHRVLMEIECINDPDELDAVARLAQERAALLRSAR